MIDHQGYYNRSLLKILILFFGIANCNNGYAQSHDHSPRFNHVFLSVRDIRSTIRFYTEAFGLKVTDSFSIIHFQTADSSFDRSIKVAFLKFPNQDLVCEIAQRPISDSISRQGNLFQHVGVEVIDIKEALQKAIKAGGKEFIPIRRVSTGSGMEILQSFIKGPDGELIELTQIIKGGY